LRAEASGKTLPLIFDKVQLDKVVNDFFVGYDPFWFHIFDLTIKAVDILVKGVYLKAK